MQLDVCECIVIRSDDGVNRYVLRSGDGWGVVWRTHKTMWKTNYHRQDRVIDGGSSLDHVSRVIKRLLGSSFVCRRLRIR